MLDLLHRHIDGKGKQAKLKSPNELQVQLSSLCLCLLLVYARACSAVHWLFGLLVAPVLSTKRIQRYSQNQL